MSNLQMDRVQSINQLIPDTPYSELNYNTTIEIPEMDTLRKRLQENIGFLNFNKQRIRHQEYTQLMNYHQYALNTLNNMVTIKQVEYSNPYQKKVSNYREGTGIDNGLIYYNNKGQIEKVSQYKKREDWETQFDQNLINPPCYMMPPTNCYK